ncbi:FAD-dependent oxidoreductase, partial [Parvibaculum sp.]|uniref:FAD-dependent oxidoreductase n=1 Tax=Parvibaculum sp. TaxID=2024848 RepID=UPI002C7C67FF
SLMDERDPARHAVSFQIRPFGSELAIAYLGGRFADEMEREGEAAMVDMAKSAIADMFGSSILGSVEKAVATAWSGDPHTLGAYASALPGHAEARPILSEPVGERIFLAGEAVHPSWFSTVQGAFLSGRDAVERAALAIGHRG